MANRYRFSIGYQRVSADLINGDPPDSSAFHSKNWDNRVIPGRIYEAYFEQIGASGASSTSSEAAGLGVGFGIGATVASLTDFNDFTGFICRWLPDANGFYTYKNVVLEGTSFFAAFIDTRDIQNLELYELDWNDPLSTIPMGWDAAKLELKRDETDFAQIEKYSTNLTFVGDGFDYLKQVLLTEGRGATVPVKIEKLAAWCSPYASNLVYETIFEGVIYLNSAVFDYPRRSVQANIEDSSAGAILNNGKNIKLEMMNYGVLSNNYYFLNQGGDWTIHYHDTVGAYPVNKYHAYSFPVFNVLRSIIRGMSEGHADLRSDYFTTDYPYLMITMGGLMWQDPIDILPTLELSFNDIFAQLDKIFNLGIAFEREGNVPVIRIEPKSYFNASTGTPVEFTAINEIAITAPKEINYRIIDIGYKNKWDFVAQTAQDIGNIIHYSSGNIADGVHLDLVSEYIEDGDYILYALEQAVNSESADIDDKIIITECELLSTKTVRTIQFSALEYNHTLNPVDNFNRWKESLPREIFGDTGQGRGYGDEFKSRLVKFSYPLTMRDFNKLTNSQQKVRLVNPAGRQTVIDGICMSCSRPMKTGIAEIEILTS